MKNLINIIIFVYLLVPTLVFALEEDSKVTITKYYKTTTYENNNLLYSINNTTNSYTEEITQEEYDSYNPKIGLIPFDVRKGYVETNYKKMTTTIEKNSDGFRYKVVLDWKNMPKTRSFDIIGIGFNNNLKSSNINFFQNYCYTSGSCIKDVFHKRYIGNSGVGASFQLPTESLSSLSQTLYFDVKKKDASKIITRQYVYGDYSHATKKISQSNSEKYSVGLNGIFLDSSISNYYDAIDSANALWSGTW